MAKKFISAVLALMLLLGALSSCADVGGGGAEPITLTIKGGETDYTATVNVGTKPKIELPVKLNHICTGLYSAEEGGMMYFDTEGDATMDWQNNFPTTLYARFESIIGKSFTSSIKWDEDPHSFRNGESTKFDIPEDFFELLEMNTQTKVQIKIQYLVDGKTYDAEVRSRISSTKDIEGEIASDNYVADFDEFTERIFTTECYAKTLYRNNAVYFYFITSYSSTKPTVRAKNLTCTVTIIE